VRIFQALPCPVFLVPGNHDGPAAFHASKATLSYLSESDISGRVVRVGRLRVLGIDTCIEAETTGALSTGDLSLLETELGVDSGGPLVIVMHHAPFETGLKAYDAISRLEGSADFAQLLQASGGRPIVLCGHIHWPYYAMWHGAACFVAGTPAAPYTSDLPFGDKPIHPEETLYSYFVHSLDAAGQHVVTPRSLSFGRHSGGEMERRR
jgi:3',5'-cyclic AMP phosphodiesterase CpdA